MCICPSRLTGLHVEQQVLAVLLGLLKVLFQVSSFAWREQRALFAVRQEVGQLGLQVTQDLLPLCRRPAELQTSASSPARGERSAFITRSPLLKVSIRQTEHNEVYLQRLFDGWDRNVADFASLGALSWSELRSLLCFRFPTKKNQLIYNIKSPKIRQYA